LGFPKTNQTTEIAELVQDVINKQQAKESEMDKGGGRGWATHPPQKNKIKLLPEEGHTLLVGSTKEVVELGQRAHRHARSEKHTRSQRGRVCGTTHKGTTTQRKRKQGSQGKKGREGNPKRAAI
jgi:hypothetical protein